MSRHRLFDAAEQEPDLLAADATARAARRSGESRARAARRSGESRARAARRSGESRARAARRSGEPRARRRDRGRSGPAVDPRIAARRAQVAADEAAATRRRGRRVALGIIGLVVAVSAGALVLLSPLASVRNVEIGGADRTGSAAVRAASGLDAGPPLVRVDEQRVAARIGALPWVRQARVERRWPRTVAIRVEERRPAAVAPCRAAGDECLVDVSGRVLAAAAADPKAAAGLPRLADVPRAAGAGAAVPEAARAALAVAVELPEALRPLVARVRGDGAEVVLELRAPGREASPPVVRLGRVDRIPDKLTAAATVLARTSVNAVAVLDVRVPESPALTRAGAARQSGEPRAGAARQSGEPRAGAARQSGASKTQTAAPRRGGRLRP